METKLFQELSGRCPPLCRRKSGRTCTAVMKCGTRTLGDYSELAHDSGQERHERIPRCPQAVTFGVSSRALGALSVRRRKGAELHGGFRLFPLLSSSNTLSSSPINTKREGAELVMARRGGRLVSPTAIPRIPLQVHRKQSGSRTVLSSETGELEAPRACS